MSADKHRITNILEMRYDYISARNVLSNWRKLNGIKDEVETFGDAELSSLLQYLKTEAPDAGRVISAVERLILHPVQEDKPSADAAVIEAAVIEEAAVEAVEEAAVEAVEEAAVEAVEEAAVEAVEEAAVEAVEEAAVEAVEEAAVEDVAGEEAVVEDAAPAENVPAEGGKKKKKKK